MIDVLDDAQALGNIDQHGVDLSAALTQTFRGEIDHRIHISLPGFQQIRRQQSRMCGRVISHLAKLSGTLDGKFNNQREQRSVLVVENGDGGIHSVGADDANLHGQTHCADARNLRPPGQECLFVNANQVNL